VPLSESNVPFVTTAGLGGSYLATNLAPGTYVTYFGAPSCSNDSPALAPRFVVGQVRVIARQTVAGPDVTLQPDGGISGVVRGAGDRPLAGICAEVLPVNGGAGAVIGVSASGRYSVTDLVPGRYRVRFEAGCGASGYATRWYKNARTRQRATVVQVSAGKTRTGISITLARS
jgi:sarcosine oxidase gamma subunit